MTDCEVQKYEEDREEETRKMQQANEERQQKEASAARKELEHETAEDLKLGYKSISFEDFLLDGKDLAKSEEGVSIQGTYSKIGDNEFLFPFQMALLMAINGQYPSTNTRIALLTDEAPRELRAYFLRCNPSGCWTRIRGRVTMCERTILWNSSELPCLVVTGGWYRQVN